MADTATLQARLTEAEDALHAMMTGSQEVSVQYEGHAATFTRTSEDKLRRYIDSLKRQLGLPTGRRSRRVVY